MGFGQRVGESAHQANMSSSAGKVGNAVAGRAGAAVGHLAQGIHKVATTASTKELGDPMAEEDPADVALDDSGGMTHEEGNEEVFGAQVLRRLHKDAILLMQEYDEMKGMLENEGIKTKLQAKLEALEEDLTEIEELWEANYNNDEMKLPPLEGSAKSMEEGDVESQDEIPTEEADETSDEDSINEEDSEPTDSQEEEEPTEEEAVGAMGSKSVGGKLVQAAHKIGGRTGGKIAKAAVRGAAKVGSVAASHPKTAVGIGAGAAGVVAGRVTKKKSMHDPETIPGYEENQIVDHPGGRRAIGVNSEKAFSELEDANDEKVQDAAHMGISFQDHHKKNMTGAHGWLSEIGNTATPDWQEEHRMKSYAWHKSMDSILDDFGYESKSLGGAVTGAIAGLAGPVGGAIHGAMAASLDAAVEGKKELEADGHKGVGGTIATGAGHVAAAARQGMHHAGRIATAVKKGSQVAGSHVARNAGKYAAGAGGVAVGGAAGYGAGRRGKDIDPSGDAQDPKTVPGYEEDQVEDHRVQEHEEGENPHMNSIANASAHLHELSQTRDFGDEHRSKALACAKDLESAMTEDSDKESQEDIPDEEDQAFEPGEMGEKSLKLRGQELSKKHKEQNRNYASLNNRMLDLLQKMR